MAILARVVGQPEESPSQNLQANCISVTAFWPPLYVMESAWLEHAPFAFWLIEALRPTTLVELGTHSGFSYLCWCQAVERLGTGTACYAVDTWTGDRHTGLYGDEVYTELAAFHADRYSAFSRLLRLQFDEASPRFADGSIDLLHIDGQHTYEAVKQDFETWLPKLSPSGVVLFHDANVRERDFGVWRLWSELSTQYPSFEFLHGHGLGVLAVGPEVPAGLRPLLHARQAQSAEIRACYARLGQAVTLQYELDTARQSLSEISATYKQLRADRDRSEQAALETKRTAVELQLQVDELIRSNAELRASLEDRQAALQRLSVELDEQLGRGEVLEQRLSVLEQSASWRVTAPLRAAAGRLPPPLRLTLRRAAKAVWWALTPHLMRTRIEFLRARRGAARQGLVLGSRIERYLAFQPAPGLGLATYPADLNGHYKLTGRPSGYVYVPPARPHDFDAIVSGLAQRPRFSIVVPTYNTAPDLLARMIASVQAQWYPDWQLILADDASSVSETRAYLAQIDDPRIETILLDRNGGISAATNSALARADGDYVVFLDHDDELTADCLYELAVCATRECPDFIYSDEDKIDPDGHFTQPFFKPDWSPDTLMSTMYTCHVSCVRRSLLEEVGPLRSEYDGAQDWDLTLRITERAARIAHIPKVLYHWRMLAASTAADFAAKPYAIEAGRRAREVALERRGVAGVLEPVKQAPGHFRVRYTPVGTPLISIIIPTRDNGAVLQRCLDSLHRVSSWRQFEIVVVDNGSAETATLDLLRCLEQRDGYRVIRHDAPFNYSELNNLAAREARGELFLFLNDDTELLSPDALERMVGYAQRPHTGAVGAKLLYPSTYGVQHTGILNLAAGPSHAFAHQPADAHGYFMRSLLEYNWIAVTGACLMLERAKFNAIGGFHEAFPVAYNDVELCFRLLQRGFYNVVCPAVRWLHHESLTRGNDLATPERRARLDADRQRLYRHHPDKLMHDPFYTPNLHPNSLQFNLAA